MDDGDVLDRTQNGVRHGSGLYVDVENLQANGQQLVETLLNDWPETTPPPSRLILYVRADLVELWRLWATSRFEGLEIGVKGIQHFSGHSSKNSADIAIATNAMADFVRGRISHVAVFSDDSDFISLYGALREETDQTQRSVPFLWVVTDRQNTLSATIKQFFPSDQLHVVAIEGDHADDLAPGDVPIGRAPPISADSAKELWTEMAQVVVQQIPLGAFRSTECQRIIKKLWPQDSMAILEGPAFGTEFKRNIWPELEKLGVAIANPGKKPIRYEMTEEAKAAVVRL